MINENTRKCDDCKKEIFFPIHYKSKYYCETCRSKLPPLSLNECQNMSGKPPEYDYLKNDFDALDRFLLRSQGLI